MKLGIIGDVHWSVRSSILQRRGEKYSIRLENLINSMNWAEQLFVKAGCSHIFCAGDFFDKNFVVAEEISALKEIKWNNIPHTLIVGNHELGDSMQFNSAEWFNMCIASPQKLMFDDFEVCLLPYILESNRQSIESYFGKPTNKRIIISHNDILGIQYGAYTSTSGFEVKDIEDNCDLFINGHLHNGQVITNKIINIGNLSGQNFTEDAEKYAHHVFVVDTDTLKIDAFENPFAFNFYKLDATQTMPEFSKLKDNAVITVKCNAQDASAVKSKINESSNIVDSRVIIEFQQKSVDCVDDTKIDLSVDHYSEFRKFIIDQLGSSDVVLSELDTLLEK